MKEIIAVSGAGLMGHGIALVFAMAGHQVRLHDAIPETLSDVATRLAATLISIDGDTRALERISIHERIADAVTDADYVFEAIPERLELKRAFFAEVERYAPPHAIFCSNTSAISITAIGAELRDAARFVGTHWWNPPYLIPLVEVVSAERSDPAVVERCIALLRGVGKVAVHVRRDVPGFIGNRLQHALWREALAIVEAGICDAETLDLVVKNSFGVRLAVLGPLENADLVGLELTRDIHATLLSHLDTSPEPNPMLSDHIAKNELGMKTGRGLREWPPGTADAVRDKLRTHLLQSVPRPSSITA